MIGASGQDGTNEELVAYLDGELSPDEVARVERRLASDPEYREQLRGLQRAWTFLDELPRTAPDAQRAQSTVTMVAQTVAQPRRRSSTWRPWAFGAAAMLTICFISYLSVSRKLRAPEDRFLRDLPVIQNVDMYRNVEDVDFLRKVIEDGLFEGEEVDV